MSISRRNFIRKHAILITSGILFYPFRNLFAQKKREPILPKWLELMELARWCPSVHNLQPHLLKIINAKEAEIFYNPNKLLPIGDPDSIFATVAMGIFIDHLSIAAHPFGYEVVITELFEPINICRKANTRFAKIKLIPYSGNQLLDSKLIYKRRTARVGYSKKNINKKLLDTFKTEHIGSSHFYFSQDEKRIEQLARINQETLFEDLADNKNREELLHLFRFSKAEASKYKYGLWSRCMGFPGKLMKSVFKHPNFWGKGISKKLIGEYYTSSYRNTKTIGWIEGPFTNTKDWLLAGKTMSRFWLNLTRHNIYMQPMGSLVTNKSAYQKLNTLLDTGSNDSRKIWLVFRMGYSKTPCRSFRLKTEELIIN